MLCVLCRIRTECSAMPGLAAQWLELHLRRRAHSWNYLRVPGGSPDVQETWRFGLKHVTVFKTILNRTSKTFKTGPVRPCPSGPSCRRQTDLPWQTTALNSKFCASAPIGPFAKYREGKRIGLLKVMWHLGLSRFLSSAKGRDCLRFDKAPSTTSSYFL